MDRAQVAARPVRQRLHHGDDFGPADLTDHDPLQRHPQRGMHQVQERDLTCTSSGDVLFPVGLAAHQGDRLPVVVVGVAEKFVLGLDGGESAFRVELLQHRPQQRRLPRFLLPSDHDVLLGAYARAEKLPQDRIDRAQPHQIVQAGMRDAVPADDRIRHGSQTGDRLKAGAGPSP
ncbi:hypothetical protein ABIE67_000359 [Streptomyces sp. V4I8]